jgi:hypothetical protein
MSQTASDKKYDSALADKRTSERHLTLQTARVTCDDDTLSLACAILDTSDDGACILVPEGASVPEMFILTLDHDKSLHRCRRAWRKGARVGVSFV